ncbi:NUMOD4 domain-containing protein [Enterobacter asburiae]|uniref:NUMOD4 domain-containing protein n=1 Tax=Enterobacter asburiae TaxID=61645 RepID=UPI001282EA24|nr:NUMOD4 domain-containing protein [Enterobacter asburiae]EAZ4787011.1 HNH endonuclease [Salmonella enterica]EBL7701063.1 HNH endonuclease [Salmonella enterica]EEK9235343.1 HNH endonuclease [Salmonella enterica]EIT5081888.1 NUMOD4 motif-containing HNH endonuclease [Salmonella enterica]EIV2516480.1 NUMOD4 motif-containing HNH endonuclease [Salmonella enterica]
MPEAWKDISGFEGIYQISDAGNLRSLDRTVLNKGSGCTYPIKGKPLKPRYDADGYLITDLWKAGKKVTVKIHRLVAAAFIPGSAPEVDHINGRRDDNRAVNLRWASLSQNRANSHTRKNKSGVVGVRFSEGKKNPWQAYGRVNGKFKSLGHFPTKQLAAAARRKHIQEVMNA